jgi:hypothetical protein
MLESGRMVRLVVLTVHVAWSLGVDVELELGGLVWRSWTRLSILNDNNLKNL